MIRGHFFLVTEKTAVSHSYNVYTAYGQCFLCPEDAWHRSGSRSPVGLDLAERDRLDYAYSPEHRWHRSRVSPGSAATADDGACCPPVLADSPALQLSSSGVCESDDRITFSPWCLILTKKSFRSPSCYCLWTETIIDGSNGAGFKQDFRLMKNWKYGFSLIFSTISSSVSPS